MTKINPFTRTPGVAGAAFIDMHYADEIIDHCNYEYSQIGDGDETVTDLEDELDIYAIAINITEVWKSKDGYVYPEISFYGDCKYDPEHGICIGFRDKKFLGIAGQDWTL